MFTSRTIIFALLSFLVGANACIQCPATLQIDGSTSYLDDTSVLNKDVTLCIYHNAKLIGDDLSMGCRYWTRWHQKNGKILDGYQSCPATVTVKDNC